MFNLIEKNDRNKIFILKLLFEAGKSETIESISSFLKIDKRTMGKLLLEIEKNFNFEIEKKGFLYFKKKPLNFQAIILHYSLESVSYKLCIDIFKEEFTTTKNFSEKNHISLTVVFNRITRLKEFLSKYDLNFNSKKLLIGEEKQIRYFYYCLFWNSYKTIEWPFDDVAFEKLYNLIVGKYEYIKRIGTSDVYRIMMWLAISISRIKKGNIIEEDCEYSQKQHNELSFNKFHEFIKVIFNNFGINSEREILNESKFLYFCFGILGINPIGSFQLLSIQNWDYTFSDRAVNYSNIWIKNFCVFFDIQITPIEYQYLHANLIVLHNRILFLKGPSSNYRMLGSEREIQNEFPFHYSKMKLFYRYLIENELLDILLQEDHNLLFKYTMLSIQVFEKRRPNLNVYISSSLGKLQENILATALVKRSEVPINIDSTISETTDLVITDIKLPEYWLCGSKYTLWNTFPSKIQIENVNELLNDIYLEKETRKHV